jgi:adenine phosphoribosyltransferase
MEALKNLIRHVPDYPKPGILFYDITTLLKDGDGFRQAVDAVVEPFRTTPIDLVVGIESRGFILGAPVAARLGVGFIPVRKPGKLPSQTVSTSYALEYGTDALEMHHDAVARDERVLIVDDLLASGGTAQATVSLLKQSGAQIVGLSFLIELEELSGRSKLEGEQVCAALRY